MNIPMISEVYWRKSEILNFAKLDRIMTQLIKMKAHGFKYVIWGVMLFLIMRDIRCLVVFLAKMLFEDVQNQAI